MEVLYCFANASLTQRVLFYLQQKMRSRLTCVTVIFLNDRWIVRLQLRPAIKIEHRDSALAFLSENGIPHRPTSDLISVFSDLDAGLGVTAAMNRHRIAIVSHGAPIPGEIEHFQAHFAMGLGYCPPSLA
ncbi:MAG: hypothetical protein ACFB5Z_18185 [Elainellaceae cyanobacterium]